MKVNEVRKLVKDLDTSKYLDQEKIWLQLRPVGEKIVPYLVDAYPTTKKWLGRAALVFHCIKYARNNEQAFQLGLNATQDRSTVVRYRACMLLAYSLKKRSFTLFGEVEQKY